MSHAPLHPARRPLRFDGCAFAQEPEQIADLSASNARIDRAPNGGRLTGPSGRNRPEIVSAFLSARHDGATLEYLVPDGEDATPRGPVHLRLRQRVQGLDVYGTYVRAAMTSEGELWPGIAGIRQLTLHPQGIPPNAETASARSRGHL